MGKEESPIAQTNGHVRPPGIPEASKVNKALICCVSNFIHFIVRLILASNQIANHILYIKLFEHANI